MKSKIPLFLMISIFGLSAYSKCQGFLKADGERIVNGNGDNMLLRGIGLGGWMLQEGYMLHLNKEGQQYRIKQRIAALIGEEETKKFYNAWLSN
ncbi:MAG TPA: glycosyl hydrolase family 5, partial [Puia sp.]